MILEQLDYVGVIGVEFFQLESGILVNEIAPRVHNSGHWSVEACATSQFEQHIRAITGLPLGSPEMLVESCEMDNLLGEEANILQEHLAENNVFITHYGKSSGTPWSENGTFDTPGSAEAQEIKICVAIENGLFFPNIIAV